MSVGSAALEVNVEARRILAVSISKLYASRSQRGGLRLHRSLLLSMVMRSARDIYHSSVRDCEPLCGPPAPEEPMDTEQTRRAPEEEEEEQPELRRPEPAAEEPEQPGEKEQEKEEEEEEVEEEEEDSCDERDKENQSPVRQSRKRRGKASAAPDFLPSKRARLEPGEERHAAPPPCCRSGVGESLSSLSLNRVIPAC